MKTLTRFAVLTLAVLGFSTSAQAKKKPADFSEFRGTYQGTLLLGVPGMAYTGTATVSVAVPKNGKSAVVTVSGALIVNQSSIPYSNTYSFSSNGAYSTPNLLLGVEGPGIAESGTYKQHQRTANYTARFAYMGGAGSTFGALSVRPAGKMRNLSFTNTITIDGQPFTYQITFQASRKLKKSER